jgi:DNA recombination protein RmuC
MIIEILLAIIAMLIAILIFVTYRIVKNRRTTVVTPSSIDSMVTLYTKIDELSKDLKNQTGGMNDTLSKKMGEIATYTSDIRQTHKSIEQMLRIPKERASFGEINLEDILADQLPPDMFGIREKILNGKIPDAYIKSTVGLICIDSRFPLDNYIKMNDAIESNKEEDRQNYKKQFIKDVDIHLLEVAKNYIDVQKGSAEFAFAYIPAESVYYFLVTEAYDMLKSYTKKGVQVVSPLTLYHKIELIKTGVHARKLSEEAEKVRNNIINISKAFKGIDDSWRILYDVHLRNSAKKAEEVDKAYKNIREEFDKVSKLGDVGTEEKK